MVDAQISLTTLLFNKECLVAVRVTAFMLHLNMNITYVHWIVELTPRVVGFVKSL